jgi:site-specific recombinase XerD
MTTATASGRKPRHTPNIHPMDLIDAHLAHIRAGGFAPETTIDDRRKLLHRMNYELPMGLEQATVEELADFLARDDWSAQTKATYYGHVRGFFKWACDPRNPRLDHDPSASLIRPKVPATVPRPVSDAELSYALETAVDPWRRMTLLSAYAGLRCIELATIRRQDIDVTNITITGKGGKQRVVPTAAEIWRVVRQLPPGQINPGWTAETITRDAGPYFRRISLPGVTMHRYRHWFATNLLRHGADLRVVQELMGHASPATTAIYCQITDEQRRNAIQALPVLTARTSA